MTIEGQVDPVRSDNFFKLIATILILFQILLFFLYYSFTANIYILGFGWLALVPGLTLVILSTRVPQDQSGKEKIGIERNKYFKQYQLHLGWSIVSLSLALIIQQWFTSLIAIGFICMMILSLKIKQNF